jgi:hypothetical protein
VELFDFVLEALELISDWKDSSGTAIEANMPIKSIDLEFIVSVYVVKVNIIIFYKFKIIYFLL